MQEKIKQTTKIKNKSKPHGYLPIGRLHSKIELPIILNGGEYHTWKQQNTKK